MAETERVDIPINPNLSLEEMLNSISLAFGTESLDILFPQNRMAELSLFSIANIDTSDLDKELVFQVKVYTLFETVHAVVASALSRSESELKRLEASLSIEIETKLVEAGKRATDKVVKNMVEIEPIYRAEIANKLNYEHMLTSFTNLLKSLDNRKDMLVQLSTKRNKQIRDTI